MRFTQAPEQHTETGQWLVTCTFDNSAAIQVDAEPGRPPPQFAELGGCKVVFDGTLYDRKDLVREVHAPERIADSNAQIVLHGYLRFGPEVFRRARGEFAIILWDATSSTLRCVRDAMGIHPLFYARTRSGILLSPSADRLRAEPDVPARLSRIVLACELCGVMPQPDETRYEQIFRVPAASELSLRKGVVGLRRYWEPSSDAAATLSAEAVVERFWELLKVAVGRHLERGPAGVYLSGGLDSAVVAAATADVSRERNLPAPWALSLTYPGLDCDEEPTQRAVASDLGMPQIMLPAPRAVGAGNVLRSMFELSSRLAAPAGMWQPAYDQLTLEARERGCQVILTGDGGDEWLAAPPFYAADRLLAGDLPALIEQVRAHRGWLPASVPAVVRAVLWKWGARPLLRLALIRALEMTAPAALRSFLRRKASRDLAVDWLLPDAQLRALILERMLEKPNEPTLRTLLDDYKRFNLAQVGLSEQLETAYELRRRLGISLFPPLLDRDVVEFLYGVSPRILSRGGHEKWIAQELLAQRVPRFAGVWPRAVYFDSAWRSVLRNEGARILDGLDGVPTLTEMGIVHAQAFATAAARDLRAPLPRATPILQALNLEFWLKSRI